MSAYAKIHVGLKQLGIDGDDARDLYERVTGIRSLRAMSPKQHDEVIQELGRLGFERSSSRRRTPLEGRFAKKLQALWISAWNLGLVRNRDDKALIAFVRRQTGIDHVRFLSNAQDARKAVEALKAWIAREADVTWPKFQDGRAEKLAVIEAQCRILGVPIGSEISAATDETLLAAMQSFGRCIRAAKGD
ncbi:regulatory protein GemA [Stappia sp. F7233]|uniref:Regulatory protein GemA n=1 Tax=Stappia albiluteola TaxID=2758565 RepID=A0A839AGA0_9HYPH|nr:regulatory protein GemA [Stappia albiluteola]MBA5777454.1 regulatory protein GemA [Stappia albiluteola]MBA5777492.1 regulatory protein GemA [Stappia albiluteola]MBA5778097.1 regulatory protein GemA [Stappia albiluteola]MBA5778126.1 regulatory protein GemA [Stappia albiluteola]